jgi:hypothetical protein
LDCGVYTPIFKWPEIVDAYLEALSYSLFQLNCVLQK